MTSTSDYLWWSGNRVRQCSIAFGIGCRKKKGKGKHLSKVGKEVLLKIVAQVIPQYAMTCFKLPDSLCESIEAVICNFWWGNGDLDRKINWVSWKNMCSAKSEGELGFHNLKILIQRLSQSRAQHVVKWPNSLPSRIFQAKYFPNGSFRDASLSSSPLFVQRSIQEGIGMWYQMTGWYGGFDPSLER